MLLSAFDQIVYNFQIIRKTLFNAMLEPCYYTIALIHADYTSTKSRMPNHRAFRKMGHYSSLPSTSGFLAT